jgi:hypothetical protein
MARWLGGTQLLVTEEETGLPSIKISPASGFSSPATQRNVVVLPQPEGPSNV